MVRNNIDVFRVHSLQKPNEPSRAGPTSTPVFILHYIEYQDYTISVLSPFVLINIVSTMLKVTAALIFLAVIFVAVHVSYGSANNLNAHSNRLVNQYQHLRPLQNPCPPNCGGRFRSRRGILPSN
ncbi:uncharacterized protein [Argopecten irradians]|uniref:uncharacterized protein n=1 Tax=Argopecten irradians TaxID=31199 RepID=UPI00371BF51B